MHGMNGHTKKYQFCIVIFKYGYSVNRFFLYLPIIFLYFLIISPILAHLLYKVGVRGNISNNWILQDKKRSCFWVYKDTYSPYLLCNWEDRGAKIGGSLRFIWPLEAIHIPSNIYGYLLATNVSSSSSKTLGERSHHHIHIVRIKSKVLHYTPASGTQRSYTMSFIDVQVWFVFLLKSNYFR